MSINVSSEEFIDKLKARDGSSITYLVKNYNKPLFYAAIKQGVNEDEAEELIQATWSDFFEGIERFEGKSHIRTYIFGILYNKIKELWREHKRTIVTKDSESIDAIIDAQFDSNGQWVTPPLDPEEFSLALESGKIIEACLEKLHENMKLAFQLKEIQGEESKNICNTMGISRTNLGVLLYRGRQLMRMCIEKKYRSGGN